MKNKLLPFSLAFISISGVQSACVLVDVTEGSSSSGMNYYYDHLDDLSLKDSQGTSTSYSLKIAASQGSFAHGEVERVIPSTGHPDYYDYFQNTQAMNDLTNTVGSFDSSSLSTFMCSSASRPTNTSIQIGGLNSGDLVTFYMFISTEVTMPDAPTMSGGKGTFGYATTNGDGFSSTYSCDPGKLTLVKWTGKVDSTTLDFTIEGNHAGVAAIAFQVVPEASTASLGVLALSSLLLRRRRSL